MGFLTIYPEYVSFWFWQVEWPPFSARHDPAKAVGGSLPTKHLNED